MIVEWVKETQVYVERAVLNEISYEICILESQRLVHIQRKNKIRICEIQ